MNDSLTSLLEKNIDLIMEAFNLDDKGNLVVSSKKKVAEADEIFHQYFVKRMNQTFRQINENDPILGTAPNMHPQGTDHGMHAMDGQHGMDHVGHDQHGMNMGMPHGMGMGADEQFEPGIGGDSQMGDMAMDDMHAGSMGHGGDMRHGGGMQGNGMPMESDQSGEYDWMNEDTDLEIDSLFNLTEDEDEEDEEDGEDEHLKEFMDDNMADFLPTGDMDHDGGANDFGGDMGGSDMDDGMGPGDMDGDDDMMTVHGHTDNGGEFEFSFDKDALGFGDDMSDDMGGDMDNGDSMSMGGHGGEHEQPGMGSGEDSDSPIGESAGEGLPGFHNSKPGKGKRGAKSSRMAVVPADPASKHAAPFPTPQGSRQK